METSLTQITDYLLTQSGQIAILVVVIAAVNFALRNKSAHVRYLLWLIVLAKCLAPPLLTIPLAILPQEQAELSPMASSAQTWPLQRNVTDATMTESTDLRSAPLKMARPPIVERKWRDISTRAWLVVGWIVGAGVFLMFNLLRAIRASFWLWRHRERLPAKLRNDIEALFTHHDIKRFPDVWFVKGFNQPFVWGLLRGSIYLPVNFLNINRPEHQRSVLGHEFSHVLRFDAAVNILQVITQALFWFHPLVWWANRKIRREREKCCDEMAVARLNTSPRDYSAAILETLAAKYEHSRPVPSLAVAGPVKNIEERIRTMLRPGKKFFKRPSLPVAMVIALMALLSVPMTIVLTVRAENRPTIENSDTQPLFGHATNLGQTVNSSAYEWDPDISADGLSLYFCSRRPGGMGGVYSSGERDADIWMATREAKDSPWEAPVNLGPTVNSSAFDGGPSISADGLSLFFTSGRPGGEGSWDIWVTRRKTKNSPWSTPVNLGPTVNSSSSENGADVSSDGLSLYFSTNKISGNPSSSGSHNIWAAKRKTKDEPWGPAVNLGSVVNSSSLEGGPSISADGLSLYFNSLRPGGLGGRDIWVTRRKTKENPWGTPFNLGPTVNTSGMENNPDISSDGSILYFIGDDVDIWQAFAIKHMEASSLQSAAFRGDFAKVKAFLNRGVDVNEKGAIGMTALHAAVSGGHKEIVEILLAKGAVIGAPSNNGETTLYQAARSGSKEIVELLLSKGADVDEKNAAGETALCAAVTGGHKEAAELLLTKGANANVWVGYQTLLHWAARRGDKETVEALLAHGAQVNLGEKYYNRTAAEMAMANKHNDVVELLISKGADISPLHLALHMKDEAKAKSLIQNGADVNKRTSYGTTPLLRAVYSDLEELVELLIEKGADVNAKDNWDWTALHGAAYSGNVAIAKMLIAAGANMNAEDGDELTPIWYAKDEGHSKVVELLRKHGAEESLHDAAATGDIEWTRSLIAKGTDVNLRNEKGQTPLHEAAKRSHSDVVEFLISKGADVNADSPDWDSTPLHCAVGSGRKGVAELLISKGADLEKKNLHGQTALHLAAYNNRTEMAEMLLARGANIEASTIYGSTPLLVAAERGHKEMARFLLSKGADLRVKQEKEGGYNLIHMAMINNRDDMVRFLVDEGLEIPPIHVAAYLGELAKVKEYLTSGADINQKDAVRLTALHCAVSGGHKDVIEYLIGKGADIHAKCIDNSTPLAFAETVDVATLLLAKGADVNIVTKNGQTPLHWAVNRNEHRGDKALVELLLKHGADVNAKANSMSVNWEGWSPFHVACRNGNKMIVEMLISKGADIHAKTNKGYTPLSLAEERGHKELVALLRKHGAKG